MKICLISHTNFLGNSAMHVFSLATELQALGNECCVLVPDQPETVKSHGVPTFPIFDYPTALADGMPLIDGVKPDFIHAWSPREHVREITEKLAMRHGIPYLVHMEDNEEQIVADELGQFSYDELKSMPDDLVDQLIKPYRSHPGRYRDFVSKSHGYTCLVDRLLEFKPEGLPGLVFWAGFDEPFRHIDDSSFAYRKRYGLSSTDIVVLYSGNVHHSIVQDVQTLYVAVGLLRQRGYPLKLVRTGWNYADLQLDERHGLSDYVIDLGFVDRADVPKIVGMSDLLVQPGRPDAFNDYRFPSKLPEYLASGRPVILPDSNIGKLLQDGEHAIKLYDGSLRELVSSIERLLETADLKRKLGVNGRAFALDNLTWKKSAALLDDFYKRTIPTHADSSRPAQMAVAPKVTSERRGEFPAKLIAFYLPQFHPIAENDRWWGKGFTEWANVVRAPRNFRLHQQPRLPTELGFYDLRAHDVMHEQVALAKEYGVHGFCFYYYWFSGKRLLDMPLNYWLSDQGPDFPFCICWANESWSRRWDGSESETLMKQGYQPDDPARFIHDVIPILRDPRYMKVDGSPVLLVYRVTDFDDAVGVVQLWRRIAREHGIPHLHLCAVQSFGISDPRRYGFDAAIEFSPPHIDRMLCKPERIVGIDPNFQGYIEDYISVAMRSINHPPVDYVRYRGLFPRWDNSARRKRKGHVFINDSCKAYAQWLRFLTNEALVRRDQQEPLIFVNAWNEWAEGAYLEPDETYGRSVLEVTRQGLVEGTIDYIRGRTPERERVFTSATARLPDNMPHSSYPPPSQA